MHPHSAINNLQEGAHRQRERQEDIQSIAAADTGGPDAHYNKVDYRDESFDDCRHEEERRFEFVRGRESDFDEGEEKAEGGEGDYYAEGCAVDRPIKIVILAKGDLFC